MAAKKEPAAPDSGSSLADTMGRISQKAVPGCLIDEALRVPRALADHYAYKPATPLQVAQALNMQPGGGQFKMLLGAAIGYGLTEGGPNAPEVKMTPLGLRIVRPTSEGDDLLAKREAFLQPSVVAAFLRKYDGAPIPRKDIARNVLESMGVPRDKAEGVLDLIVQGARPLGLIVTIKDRDYVNLKGVAPAAATADQHEEPAEELSQNDDLGSAEAAPTPAPQPAPFQSQVSAKAADRLKRVFVSHGKNKTLIEPIKKLLAFGELEAVVSVERQSVSQPVPDKVMSDMRDSGAAIIHVDPEPSDPKAEGQPMTSVNANVLIEIGAAMALYGRRFILLVRQGAQLPSNLQGLYEVRYATDNLDAEATIRLLEAIRDIKNHPLPG